MSNLQDLYEKITGEFVRYKEGLNSQEYTNVTQLLYTLNNDSDRLFHTIKYHLDEYFESCANSEDDIGIKLEDLSPNSDVSPSPSENEKAASVIKLQSILSKITFHVLSDLITKHN